MAIAPRLYTLVVIVWIAMAGCAPSSPPRATTPESLSEHLRAGGLVLLFHHPAADASQQDPDPGNFDDVTAQRQLTDEGRAQARAIGAALRRIGAPVAEIHASRYRRCAEAAQLMELGNVERSDDFTHIDNSAAHRAERERRQAAARRSLAAKVSTGNIVVVTHASVIEGVLGAALHDVKEGEAVIVHAHNGALNVIRRVPVEVWSRL